MEKAQSLIHDKPLRLDAEQVILTAQQVDCGVREDLWEAATVAGQHTSCRLLPAGKALSFDDDVMLNEPGYHHAYAQVRGDFQATLADGPDIRAPEENVRMVSGKLAITINHSCFSDPVYVVGVRKGNFDEDTPPTMRFELLNDGWHYDKLVH
ncbi:MAG TPA: hypothetical protein VGN17_00185 [Bryobacteraceae bacterium]|jgi:hypothetical protein